MTVILTAASCFVAGMLVEAVVWGRAAHRLIRRLQLRVAVLTDERNRWRAVAHTRHPSLRNRGNGHLRAVDE